MSGPAAWQEESLQHHQLGMDGLGSWGRSPGMVVGSELDVRQQCAMEAKATNSLQGGMIRNIPHRLREGMIPLYTALVRPRLDTMLGFGPPSTG